MWTPSPTLPDTRDHEEGTQLVRPLPDTAAIKRPCLGGAREGLPACVCGPEEPLED